MTQDKINHLLDRFYRVSGDLQAYAVDHIANADWSGIEVVVLDRPNPEEPLTAGLYSVKSFQELVESLEELDNATQET